MVQNYQNLEPLTAENFQNIYKSAVDLSFLPSSHTHRWLRETNKTVENLRLIMSTKQG